MLALKLMTTLFLEKLREDLARMEIGMENISKKLLTFAIPGEELKDEGQFTITGHLSHSFFMTQ